MNWWCQKLLVSYTVLTCSRQDMHNKEEEDFTESTGVVLAKYLSKVKLEFLTALECQSRSIKRTFFWGFLGFYSGVELNYYACVASLFLIGKILINECILQKHLCIRILFALGFYRLGLTVGRKSFLFRISWGPHNEQLSATWPFGPSTPFVRPCRIRLLLVHLLSKPSIQSDLPPSIFFLFSLLKQK